MTPANLQVVVNHDPEEVKSEALAWPERAAALKVTDAESYTAGGELLKAIKALRNRIADTFDTHIKRAHEAHKALVKEKADAEAPLTQAEGTIKRALIAYTEAEERKRREEERRLAEEARKAEEARRLEEAAALEAMAVETGDTEMMATAQEIVSAPVPAPVVVLPKTTPKVAGLSYREVWRFRVVNAALVPRQYLTVNEQAIGGVVRAMKGATVIPGVEVYSEKVASASGR
jgi:hypothetical protein